MNTKIKRPATVWIAQIILLLFSLSFVFSLVNNTWGFVGYISAGSVNTDDFRHLVIGYAFLAGAMLILLLLFLSSFYGLIKRRNWGRRLSVVSMLITLALVIIGQIARPTGSLAYYEYRSETESAAGFLTTLVIDGLLLLLIVLLAFSKKVTNFFSGEVRENPV